MEHRLKKVFKANFIGQIIGVVIQLGSVPLFLSNWGKTYYGEWLLISTFPNYLSMADLGLNAVLSNEITIKMTQGKHSEANYLFQRAWGSLIIVSVMLVGIILGSLLFYGNHLFKIISHIDQHSISLIICLLALSVLINLQNGLLQGVYTAHKQNYLSANRANLSRFLEFFFSMLAIIYRADALMVAEIIVAVRFLYSCLIILELRKKYNDFKLIPSFTNLSIIFPLLRPSLSYSLFSISNGLLIQATTAIVGYNLGSGKVVIFTTTRTLTNTIKQLLGFINNSVWNEFSILISQHKLEEARTLHLRTMQISILLTVLTFIFLLLSGDYILQFWTKGKVYIEQPFFFLMLCVLLLESLWSVSFIVTLSVNKHEKTALTYIFSSIAAIFFSIFTIQYWGLSSIPISLFLVNISMSIVVFRLVATILNEHLNYIFLQKLLDVQWLKKILSV